MNNIAIETKGDKLVITIDATVDLGPSASGKTRLVASTQGNKKIVVDGREIHLGINAYTK
jgi:hypothetical protein